MNPESIINNLSLLLKEENDINTNVTTEVYEVKLESEQLEVSII